MRAADYLFKKAGSTPAGLALSINATIPTEAGLGDVPALLIGGLVAANNLINIPFKRDQLADMAVELCRELAVPLGAAVTSLFGGLVVTSVGQTLLHRRIDVPAQKLVLILPEIAGYQDKVRALPLHRDTSFHVSQSALLIEGFRKNDTKLVEQIMRDAPDDPRVPLIPGYAAAVEAGRKAGAFAVALSGTGPALVALTQSNQKGIEADIQKAFTEAGVKVRCWQLNMDTQGVALSVSG
jgi:homoserine kinase